jgi:hypothetical protein
MEQFAGPELSACMKNTKPAPAERGASAGADWFGRFARHASVISGKPAAFFLAVAVVAI